ncbi:[protein-PII] uridylyltransferase [Ramlibacter sp. CrO1]|uniref:Bifunctional uridylyltransferase/uridylyl-removing enzyme n=1 Tax=Ramlibacter algicola TaxID=2795217 RepID=A0A934Q304_9BURK|nr:[protein-PII] uridylyltransferase [Ramlibacter algicola]MBK0393344.1 [protein-PII] uridylyltransferase [Ramlibacter algicola]
MPAGTAALPNPCAALRDRLKAQKDAVNAALLAPGLAARAVRPLLRRLARHVDAALRELWDLAEFPTGSALVAVGGYGRGELFPHSDVDVLLLLPDGVQADGDASLKQRLEGFIGNCWDTGLEIGSSVRTVAECVQQAQADVTIQTSLLESRLLAGDAALFADLQARSREVLDPQAFFIAKTLEMRQRHTKYENTPYSLEPNCKESPGGLRDLQVILWIARAARFGTSWDELARRGLATDLEARQLQRNEALLDLIRARLHAIARRREDRLVFDLQTAVAETFGYRNVTTPEGRLVQRASEQLMKRFYWAAKAVTQLNQILLLNIEERLIPGGGDPEPLNARFLNKGGMLEVVDDGLYQREPQAILETFLLYQTTMGIKGLSARTLRALYNARGVMDAKFRNDPINHATFRAMLMQPAGLTHSFRLMNQTSVLGRYLWPFRRIVGQMQHDLFHVYTVDQHILMVLRNVRRFFIAEHAHEYPFCSQLAAGYDRPWVLYIAALFHDIAKGRGGDHSELGGQEVRRFCRQHGFKTTDARLVEFLVREHLTMSRIAQKEDLSDPEVISAFAARVKDERTLTALYLLTVADIRGTSPKVWNAWKGKLLEDLYRATLRALGGHQPDTSAEIEQRKREALVQMQLHSMPFEAHKKLWDTLDVGYFMRHDAGEIAWHTRHISRHVGATKALVRARRSPAGEGLQVVVYTPDQPDLFARICGYFDQAGFSILDARIHTARNGYALDTFQVVTAMLPEHYRELVSMVENGLEQTLERAGPLPAPSRGRVSRRVKSFPVAPRVQLAPDERAQRWLLSISASDRLGLLYSIALVLAKHKINLQLAKVTTLGERVEDTFLVDGPELQQNRRQIEIETELLEALAA